MTAPDRIYLDHAATTPLDPRVLEALLDLVGRVAYETADPHRRAALTRHVELVLGAADGAVRQPEDLVMLRTVGEQLVTRLRGTVSRMTGGIAA